MRIARPTHRFSPFKKSSLENYLKELNELKNEKLFLKNELDLLQQEFFAEVCPALATLSPSLIRPGLSLGSRFEKADPMNPLQLILRNYATQMSNLTSRFQNAESGFIKLARMINSQASAPFVLIRAHCSPRASLFT